MTSGGNSSARGRCCGTGRQQDSGGLQWSTFRPPSYSLDGGDLRRYVPEDPEFGTGLVDALPRT